MSPFQDLYGRSPPPFPAYEVGSTIVDEVDEQLQNCDEVLNNLKATLEKSINQMKQTADSKRRDDTYDVCEWVYLHLQPYLQHSVFRRTSQKFATRYYGPFEIIENFGHVAYRHNLPEGMQVHSVFHVSLLKKRVGSDVPMTGMLPPLRNNGTLQLQLERVLDQRQTMQGKKLIHETLIQWKGLSLEEAMWEATEWLKESFSDLNLKDKFHFQGGSIDKCQGQVHRNGPQELGVRRYSTRARRPNRKFTDREDVVFTTLFQLSKIRSGSLLCRNQYATFPFFLFPCCKES